MNRGWGDDSEPLPLLPSHEGRDDTTSAAVGKVDLDRFVRFAAGTTRPGGVLVRT